VRGPREVSGGLLWRPVCVGTTLDSSSFIVLAMYVVVQALRINASIQRPHRQRHTEVLAGPPPPLKSLLNNRCRRLRPMALIVSSTVTPEI